MPKVKDLMGVGVPAGVANLLGGSVTLDGNLTITGSTSILANSADGADTYRLDISAAGAVADTSRGAFIILTGNENGSTGIVTIGGGNVAGGHVSVAIGNASSLFRIVNNSSAVLWTCSNAGDFSSDATNGGNLIVARAGRGLQVKEGSNAKMGTATLTAGSVVVANTSVTATSRIFLTSNADGGTPGFVRVSARTPATSFTITSSSGTDTSTIAWFMVEPAA